MRKTVTPSQQEQANQAPQANPRRAFIKTLGAGGAAAALTAAALTSPSAGAAVQSSSAAASPPAARGYRKTDHIRRYYALARGI